MSERLPPTGMFRGRNFMTPDFISYHKLKEGWAELSSGTGLNTSKLIYGVTVRGGPAKSQMFEYRSDAKAFIGANS